eukprot:9470753-Pyramimonas_sp.AAC.1
MPLRKRFDLGSTHTLPAVFSLGAVFGRGLRHGLNSWCRGRGSYVYCRSSAQATRVIDRHTRESSRAAVRAVGTLSRHR